MRAATFSKKSETPKKKVSNQIKKDLQSDQQSHMKLIKFGLWRRMTLPESESLTINYFDFGQFCLQSNFLKHSTIENQMNQTFYRSGKYHNRYLGSYQKLL
jgi:hypothetical protein